MRVPAGSWKQAFTSTHTSPAHTSSSILHADLSHHIQQGKQGCRMVLPRFPFMLRLDWLRVTFARYEYANATGGGAELVEGTVKSTPTCMNRRHKTIVPDHGGFEKSIPAVNRILPVFLEESSESKIPVPNSKAAHSRIAWFWLHAGRKRFRFRGFRRLAAVQTGQNDASAGRAYDFFLLVYCSHLPRVSSLATTVGYHRSEARKIFLFRAVQLCRLRRISSSAYLFFQHCDTPYRQLFSVSIADTCDIRQAL